MNKQRRKELQKALEMIQEARSIIEAMQEEEQDCFDNLPEGIQMSEKGETIEENADRLSDVADELATQEDELEDIING